jgi:hypothetical protein
MFAVAAYAAIYTIIAEDGPKIKPANVNKTDFLMFSTLLLIFWKELRAVNKSSFGAEMIKNACFFYYSAIALDFCRIL